MKQNIHLRFSESRVTEYRHNYYSFGAGASAYRLLKIFKYCLIKQNDMNKNGCRLPLKLCATCSNDHCQQVSASSIANNETSAHCNICIPIQKLVCNLNICSFRLINQWSENFLF